MKTWLLLAKQGVKTCLGFKFFHLLSSKLNSEMHDVILKGPCLILSRILRQIRAQLFLLCSLVSVLGVPQMCRTALLSIISTSGTGRWRLKIQIRMKTEHEWLLFPGILFKSSCFLWSYSFKRFFFSCIPFLKSWTHEMASYLANNNSKKRLL